MNIDFSLLLLVLSGVSGSLWLLDRFVFASPRMRRLETFLQSNRLEPEEFRDYLASLDEHGRPPASADTRDPAKHKLLAKAWELYREPVVIEYAKSFFPILFAVLLLRSFLYEPFLGLHQKIIY